MSQNTKVDFVEYFSAFVSHRDLFLLLNQVVHERTPHMSVLHHRIMVESVS